MSNKAREIMAILDEGKESVPDGLYLQLANALGELHNEQPQVVVPPPEPTRPDWEIRWEQQRILEQAQLRLYHARQVRNRELGEERRRKQAERINALLPPEKQPYTPEDLVKPPDPFDNLYPVGTENIKFV
jgi:hypothetical protein